MNDQFENIENRGPFAVLKGNLDDWDFFKTSQVLENCLGLHPLDAKQMARREPGIIADNMTLNLAERLARDLQQVGVSTVIAPCRDLLDLPREFQARNVQFSPGKLIFHGEDNRKTTEIEPQKVFAVCVGRLFRLESTTNATTAKTLSHGLAYHGMRVRDVTITTKGTKESWPFALCLLQLNPLVQIRVYSDKFNYRFLNQEIIERSDEAFVDFLKVLVENCPNAVLNTGAESVLKERDMPKSLNFNKERLFEEYAHWFLQIALCNSV